MRQCKEKNSRTVFRTTFKADVSNPLLEFSSPTVHFRYDWEPDVLTRADAGAVDAE